MDKAVLVQHRSNTLKTFIKARFSTEDSSGLFLTLLLLMLIVAACVFGSIAEDVVNRDPLTITESIFNRQTALK